MNAEGGKHGGSKSIFQRPKGLACSSCPSCPYADFRSRFGGGGFGCRDEITGQIVRAHKARRPRFYFRLHGTRHEGECEAGPSEEFRERCLLGKGARWVGP